MTVHHPAPATIGKTLEHVAQMLRNEVKHDRNKTHCACIACAAARLAANGWPASVSGDGRGNGGALTLVEAAASTDPPFRDVDRLLAKELRLLWSAARKVEDRIVQIRRHGNDSEQVASLGDCVCCGAFCNPRANPNDRLVSGLCPACLKKWYRWRKLNPAELRSDFIRQRKAELDQGATA